MGLFTIIFDHPGNIYHPGQTVTGKVVLHLDSARVIKEIEVRIKGSAQCEWRKSPNRTASGTRKSEVVYINKKEILCGGGGKRWLLPVGEHTYPFAVTLPRELPSSFNGLFGYVTYYAKAKINIPKAFHESTTQCFTVVNLLNLNNFPELRIPHIEEKGKLFSSLLFCNRGTITATLFLPKTGFTEFESIPITIEVDNASSDTVNMIHVSLQETTEYRVERKIKREAAKLRELHFNAVDEGQSQTGRINLTIPQIGFPYLENCSIIKRYHELRVEVEFPEMWGDLEMSVPITFGNIPFEENTNAQALLNNDTYLPGTQSNTIPPDHDVASFMAPEANLRVPKYRNRGPIPRRARQVLPPYSDFAPPPYCEALTMALHPVLEHVQHD